MNNGVAYPNKSPNTLRLAFILPRYGQSLGGGAEALIRSLVLQLQARPYFADIRIEQLEVWTTCAIDHRTWDNYFPPGVVVEDGVTVRRFSVEPRDIDTFLQAEFAMRDGFPLTPSQQLDWLAAGVNSKGLYEHIATNNSNFDALFFAPYLFPTTFWGSLLCSGNAILVPCLHNEHYAYQTVMKEMFFRARGLLFNALPEMDLCGELFGREMVEAKGAVVGMGFEPPIAAEMPKAHSRARPFLLYSGRKEQGKNLDLLLDWFEILHRRLPELDLLLIGSGSVDFRAELPEGVLDLGFVSETEKLSLMRQALLLCQPSMNESFSIVMMEAWLQECPVLVHRDCPVTRHHVVQSGGGLYCGDADEFIAAVRMLLKHPSIRQQFARAGREYVRSEYAWTAVLDRLESALRKIGVLLPSTAHNTPTVPLAREAAS